ncbi:MAG: VCBS repeat-containing protein [Verrucomicrobia bacterium]|nr:VCBS repeat-containing protein [Verrucomicrobiota bacterium]
MQFMTSPQGCGGSLRLSRSRIVVARLAPVLFLLLLSPQAGFGATPPTWNLAPWQSPNGVVLAVPGIAPMETETQSATISVGVPIDIAGDGRPEVFFCHGVIVPNPPVAQPCRIIELGPDGSVEDRSFALLGPELPAVIGNREITVADFNGDDQPDIFVGASGYDADPFPGERNVLPVSRPDGTYENRSASLPVVPDFTHSTTAADLEGDGDIDIMVGNLGLVVDPAKTYLLINDGDGNFVQDTSRLPATLADREEFYTDFLLVDANGDGFPDLFMGTWMPCCPSAILLNDGSGSFANLPRIELPPGPLGAGNENVQDAVAMMLNDDELPDLVVLSTLREYAGTGVQALVSNGDGTFRDESATRFGVNAARLTGDYYGNLRLADLNADGAMDFHYGNGLDTQGRYWICCPPTTWACRMVLAPIRSISTATAGRTSCSWVTLPKANSSTAVSSTPRRYPPPTWRSSSSTRLRERLPRAPRLPSTPR